MQLGAIGMAAWMRGQWDREYAGKTHGDFGITGDLFWVLAGESVERDTKYFYEGLLSERGNK